MTGAQLNAPHVANVNASTGGVRVINHYIRCSKCTATVAELEACSRLRWLLRRCLGEQMGVWSLILGSL